MSFLLICACLPCRLWLFPQAFPLSRLFLQALTLPRCTTSPFASILRLPAPKLNIHPASSSFDISVGFFVSHPAPRRRPHPEPPPCVFVFPHRRRDLRFTPGKSLRHLVCKCHELLNTTTPCFRVCNPSQAHTVHHQRRIGLGIGIGTFGPRSIIEYSVSNLWRGGP